MVAITRIPIVVRDFDAVRQVAARLAPTVAQTFEPRLERRRRIAAIVAHQQQHEIQEYQFHRRAHAARIQNVYRYSCRMPLGRKCPELGLLCPNARPPTKAGRFSFASLPLRTSLHGRDAGFGRLMVLQWGCAAHADSANDFAANDDWHSARRRHNSRQSQYEGFSRRKTILVCFCGYPEGSSCFRFSCSYWYRGVASEIRFLKRDEVTAAIDNGENMIPAVLFTFCGSGGDRRFCLFKRNWHA